MRPPVRTRVLCLKLYYISYLRLFSSDRSRAWWLLYVRRVDGHAKLDDEVQVRSRASESGVAATA